MRKKTILAFIVMLFVLCNKCNAQSTKIDFDYSKQFNVKYIFLDYNGNKEADDGEFVSANEKTKITLGLVYKDFGDTGNILDVEIKCENKDTKKEVLIKGVFEDIDFGYVKENGDTNYLVKNKLDDIDFAVLVQKEETTVAVFNVLKMKIITK